MEPYLTSILETVPDEIRKTAKEFISEHVSIFEPKRFVIGKQLTLDHYHFVLLNSPPPLMKIGNKVFQFKKRSLIAFEPEMELSILPFDGLILADYFSISISKEFFHKIVLEVFEYDKIQLQTLEHLYSRRLIELIANFKDEIANYRDRYPLMVNSIATQIAIQILRDIHRDDSIHRKNGCNEQKYIKKAIEFMENHFDCNITLGEISREIFVSQAHFERMFKYHTGQTPHQYLIMFRIQKAKEMILKEECSLEEIAKRCGFISLSHFSTVFKRIVGVPPSDFKKLAEYY